MRIWQTIRHNKLFAAIYIFGTALALASTTVAVVVLNSMIAPVYPEYDRLSSAFIQRLSMELPRRWQYGILHVIRPCTRPYVHSA